MKKLILAASLALACVFAAFTTVPQGTITVVGIKDPKVYPDVVNCFGGKQACFYLLDNTGDQDLMVIVQQEITNCDRTKTVNVMPAVRVAARSKSPLGCEKMACIGNGSSSVLYTIQSWSVAP